SAVISVKIVVPRPSSRAARWVMAAQTLPWPAMSGAPSLPLSLRLILRDRTRSDVDQVVLAAIGDLVNEGVWRHEHRGWALRRRHLLARASRAPLDGDVPEPLRFIDGLLVRAAADPEVGDDMKRMATWIGRNAHGAGTTAVHKGIDQLVADGLLTSEWRPTR